MSRPDRRADGPSAPRPAPAAGIVLAGGAGRRLGGVDKPGLIVDGETLLDRALSAVGAPVIVVGPRRPTALPVTFVAEDPPGSGPAAALHAGMGVLTAAPAALVVVLAADLPGVSVATVNRLVGALSDAPDADGAVLLDADGREQSLLSVWRYGPLRAACGVRTSWAGASLRALLGPLHRIAVPAVADEAADIDTPDQWRRWR